jgi:OOP family OmpA-OmpF porin
VLSGALLGATQTAQASPWSGRASASAAIMLSGDQIRLLHYDSVGFLGSVGLSLELISRLSAQWNVRGGTFLSKAGVGGLLGTTLGLRLHSVEREIRPYLSLDAGMAVTGTFVRPWIGATAGIEWKLNDSWRLGPVVGVDDVIQWNDKEDEARYTDDAVFLWAGIGVTYDGPTQPPPPPKPRPAPPPPPPPEAVTVTDTVEIDHLIERTLGPSTNRLELLAPVLFALDSDQIEPVGVAMLHEVAHTLRTRPEIVRLEVQGYADARGSAEHNQALSQRRAERVRNWLIEHGVAPERLVVAPQGETAPVEPGESEGAHEQNRRVIFRVLELAEP